jgi:hypothetical protein
MWPTPVRLPRITLSCPGFASPATLQVRSRDKVMEPYTRGLIAAVFDKPATTRS